LRQSAFAGYGFPPEVIALAVRWYLRFDQTLLRWHCELVRRKWTYRRRGPASRLSILR
jgi:transposase-like protein